MAGCNGTNNNHTVDKCGFFITQGNVKFQCQLGQNHLGKHATWNIRTKQMEEFEVEPSDFVPGG